MLATAVGIQADGERDVGAVVFREEGLGAVDEELRARMRPFVRIGGEVVGIGREEEWLEAIRGIEVRAAAMDRGEGIVRRRRIHVCG